MKKGCVVVGYGGMGGWHTRHILEAGAVDLLGIYDIKKERCELAEQNGIHAYSSFEEVLADPRVDFITIATPELLRGGFPFLSCRLSCGGAFLRRPEKTQFTLSNPARI